MNVNNYDFYTGLQAQPSKIVVLDNTVVDLKTGQERVDERFFSSGFINVNGRVLFFDTNFETSVLESGLCYYDANKNFVSGETLKGKGGIFMPAPLNAAFFRISVNKEEPFLNSYVPDSTGEEEPEMIDFIFSVQECNPIYKKLVRKISKESGQEFFRTKIDADFKLYNKDFRVIATAPLDSKFMLLIYENGNIKGPIYKGFFKKTDCKFDTARELCKLKLSDNDEYSAIVDGKGNSYDLVKLAVPLTDVRVSKRPVLQVYEAGESRITNIMASGAFWEADVIEIVSDKNTLIDNYHFAVASNDSEFEVNVGEAGYFLQSLSDSFRGNLSKDQNNKLVGINRNLRIFLRKVVSAGTPVIKAGLAESVQGLVDRKVIGNTYEDSIGGTLRYDKDAYQLVIENDERPGTTPHEEPGSYRWASDIYFWLDSKTLYIGVGPKINFISETAPANGLTGELDRIILHQIFQRLLCDTDTVEIPDSSGVHSKRSTFDIPSSDFAAEAGLRNLRKCIGVNVGRVVTSPATSLKPTRYGRDDRGFYFVNPLAKTSPNRCIPLTRNTWTNLSFWLDYEVDLIIEQSATKEYFLRNAYKLADVIKALLKKISPGLRHEGTPEYSKFLYSPDRDKLYKAEFSPFCNLVITQKTNLLKGEFDEAATKAEITLEDVLSMLRDCFRCFCFIDSGKFKIEHIKHFNDPAETQVVDLTKEVDGFNGRPALFFQTELEYDTDGLASRYEFDYADSQSEPFSGGYIDVKANYVDKSKKESVMVANFATDIDMMLAFPSNFTSDGFALLGTVTRSDGTQRIPISEITHLYEPERPAEGKYTSLVQNGVLAWNELFKNYMYDMPAFDVSGTADKSYLQVKDVYKCMENKVQVSVPYNLISVGRKFKTIFGAGILKSADTNLITGFSDVSLSYKPV